MLGTGIPRGQRLLAGLLIGCAVVVTLATQAYWNRRKSALPEQYAELSRRGAAQEASLQILENPGSLQPPGYYWKVSAYYSAIGRPELATAWLRHGIERDSIPVMLLYLNFVEVPGNRPDRALLGHCCRELLNHAGQINSAELRDRIQSYMKKWELP